MFTGLIEDVGRVEAVDEAPAGAGRRLTIATRLADATLAIGDSIAVDGTCLTAVARAPDKFSALAAPETLARTTLGLLAVGARVNLERPLKLSDRLGGHLVAGHVDGLGRIDARTPRGEAIDVAIATAPALLRYVVEKGSIAVDGISLTVNTVESGRFWVSLIPHTQTATTLSDKPVGQPVNLEVDIIGKYVERLLLGEDAAGRGATRSALTLEKLREHGFVP